MNYLDRDPTASEAADTFRRLLEADPKGTRLQFDEICAEMRCSHLLVGDDIAPFCFAPALISQKLYSPVREQVAGLMRIFKRLEPMLLRPRWLDALGISPQEQDLIRLPAGFDLGLHVSRVDGFLGPSQGADDSGFRVVELNVDSPGGAAYLDAAAALLSKTPVWQEFRRLHPGHVPQMGHRILALLTKAWKLWGGIGKPRVGIVDWVTVSTASEFDVLKAQFLRAGVETVVCDPRELEYSGGKLRDYDGKPLDLVYRRVLVEDILAHGPEARALLDAYRAGSVCLLNPFRCKPLTVKSLMAILHTVEMEEILTAQELTLVRTLIPWTALVEDGPQLQRIENERESLVLKPADGWGGEGIFLGWETTDDEWRAAIDTALKQPYIAQERVAIPSAKFPVAKEADWDFQEFRVDLNPFTFAQEVGFPLIRLSQSDLLNIKTGGRLCLPYQLGLSAVS